MKFKLHKEYVGNIIISESFIRETMQNLTDTELRAYLYLCLNCHNKADLDLNLISQELGVKDENLIEIFSRLEREKLIKISSSSVTLLPQATGGEIYIASTRQYTPEEIASFDDKDVKALVNSAERNFGKLLSHGDVNSLMGLYNWLGMPVSVLTILIEYAASNGKKSMAYIEKTAMDWNDQEINTPKKAHEYIRMLEHRKTIFEQMKNLLGIYGRDLTKKEKEYITDWTAKFTAEEIKEAYEKTIDSTGKISFAYTNKILNGGDNTEQKIPVKKAVKPSNFNNFPQKPSDFDAIEKKALEKLYKLQKKGNE